MCRRIAVALLAGVLSFSAAGIVRAEALNLRFDVFVSGLRVMKVHFRGDVSRDVYRGAVGIRPKGFASLFLKKRLDMRTQGIFNDAHARPSEFHYRSSRKGRERTALVRWKDGRVTAWTRRPPTGATERGQIMAALSAGALDPLSVLFAIGRKAGSNPCAGRYRVFDGLDVYDLKLTRAGRDRVSGANFAGPALKCRMIYIPVAGMSERKKRRQLSNPPVFTVWLARVKSADAGAVWVPVRAVGRMKGRPFTASLGDATLGGGPLRAATN